MRSPDTEDQYLELADATQDQYLELADDNAAMEDEENRKLSLRTVSHSRVYSFSVQILTSPVSLDIL